MDVDGSNADIVLGVAALEGVKTEVDVDITLGVATFGREKTELEVDITFGVVVLERVKSEVESDITHGVVVLERVKYDVETDVGNEGMVLCKGSSTPIMVCANPLLRKNVPRLETQLQSPVATSGSQHQTLFPHGVKPPSLSSTGLSTIRQHIPYLVA